MSKLVNFYNEMPEELKPIKIPNLGFENHGISLPCRILICGASNQGKTLSILNYLRLARDKKKGLYDHIHIFTKKSEALYEYMEHKSPKCVTIHEVDDSFEFPRIEDFDGTLMNFVIFDDLIADKAICEKVKAFFIRGRKLRPKPLNMAFLSQDFRQVPQLIRKNISHLWLFKPSTEREKHVMYGDVPLLKNPELWARLEKKDHPDDPNNFINIDINKNLARINFGKPLNSE